MFKKYENTTTTILNIHIFRKIINLITDNKSNIKNFKKFYTYKYEDLDLIDYLDEDTKDKRVIDNDNILYYENNIDEYMLKYYNPLTELYYGFNPFFKNLYCKTIFYYKKKLEDLNDIKIVEDEDAGEINDLYHNRIIIYRSSDITPNNINIFFNLKYYNIISMILKLKMFNLSIENNLLKYYKDNKIIKIINELQLYIDFIKKNKIIKFSKYYTDLYTIIKFIQYKKITIYIFENLITELENILRDRLKVYWVYLTTQLKK